MGILTIGQIAKTFRTRRLPTGDCIKLSNKTIKHMANKLRYPLINAGGKIGYYDSILMAIMQHIREAVEYEKSLTVKKPQRALKQPNMGDYYTYNGERDNKDYEWELTENKGMNQLTILWLDDQRDPYKYLNTKSKSNTFLRNKQFYDNLMRQYDINFVWVKNLYQFIEYIENNGLPQFVSFDHDLNNRGGGEGLSDEEKMNNNGLNCAKWLVNYCKQTRQPLPRFYVHSANPKHGPEINRVLSNENKIRRAIFEAISELELYHGTPHEFDEFDLAYLSSGFGQQSHGYGVYLTTSTETAKAYSQGKNIYTVEVPNGKYLNYDKISKAEAMSIAKKFFKYYITEHEYGKEAYANHENDFWEYECRYLGECYDGGCIYGTLGSFLGNDKNVSEFLYRIGYKGLCLKCTNTNTNEKFKNYVIFNPKDIKILKKNNS